MRNFWIILVASLSVLSSCNDNKKTETQEPKPSTDSIAAVPLKEIPQTVDGRISDIKAWYEQIQGIGEKNCKKKTRTKYDSFSQESEKIPFEQQASICALSDEFELIRGEFSGYEWGNTVSIYKKEGHIFFVFIKGGSEGWTFERRYYCDKDENVFQHLEREADGGEEPTGPQKEMKLNDKNPNIRDYIKSDIDELQLILGTKI